MFLVYTPAESSFDEPKELFQVQIFSPDKRDAVLYKSCWDLQPGPFLAFLERV